MTCDLDLLFGPLARRVPEDDDSRFAFSADTVPRPPASLHTDRLVVETTCHAYDGHTRRDALAVHATKATYRNLAGFIASVLFCPTDVEVTLFVDHPASRIRRIVVRQDSHREAPPGAGFHSLPHRLNYCPAPVTKHPWDDVREVWDLPAFLLDEGMSPVAEWSKRDTVVGFGSDRGTARLVELLLDASRSSSQADEFELEGEGGFRGVAPFSAEVRLWLPGSFGWKPEYWSSDS
jgi:hypothetical protein